jgi:hypothetical protein
LIQNNKNWIKHLVFNFTIVKIIAFSIIYIFGIVFFFFIKFYFLKNYNFFFYSGEIEVTDYIFLSDLFWTQSHLLSIFYILFTVTIVALTLMNWRENEFFIEKMQLLTNILGVLTFYTMTSRVVVLLTYAGNMFNF